MKYSIILKLLAFICLAGRYEVATLQLPETVQIHTGVILERITSTVFVNSYLDVFIDLRCSPHLYRQVKSLAERAHGINCSFYSVRLENMRNKNNVDGSLAYYESHVKVFDIEIIKFYTMYNNVISSHWIQAYKQGSERKKRGWINAGGSLLKIVFGVALDSDIKAIEKKVNFLENQEFGNSEVLVNLRDQLKENNNALIHVEKELQKLRHDSSGFHAQLNLLSYVTLATSYLQSLNNFLATVKAIQAEVEKTLLYALAKSSSPSIYTFDLLNPFIQKVSLETGLETPVKLDRSNMAKFLKYTWSAVPTSTDFSVVLIIPFVYQAMFDTVKVHRFPT